MWVYIHGCAHGVLLMGGTAVGADHGVQRKAGTSRQDHLEVMKEMIS